MKRSTLIRGGRIVTASEDFQGDMLVIDGKITALGADLQGLAPAGAQVIDAMGLYVLPGAVDAHTHLDLPFTGTSSSDDFQTGTIAALEGGTTSIIDFAIQEQGRTFREALLTWHEKAAGKAVIDYSFHLAVTDLNEKTVAELPTIVDGGVTSFKCFMAYKGALMVDDGQLFRLMRKSKELGALVTLHAENAEIITELTASYLKEGRTSPVYHELSHPDIAEGEATHRAIALARVAGCPIYIVHLTCNEALEAIKQSIHQFRHPVFAETCPQYLLLDRNRYEGPDFEGAKYVMSPPLRTPQDQEALWAALRDGLIQTLATDHCPFHFHGQKEMGRDNFSKIPNGAPGIENRLNLMHTYGVLKGRISLNRWIQVCCSNPAKIFGLYPQKGSLTPGADADIVLYDPTKEGTIQAETQRQRCDYSTFEGFKTKGAVSSVMIKGGWVVRDGKNTGNLPHGQFLKRSRFHPLNQWIR